ncbi:MAG: Asp-tRNA(Asn)/Glu-tRNA(Gln) amidotransferase subunit GatA [Spirochaetaceae bacterium]|jgi:aspartyl-tRNA(Asn)/glutamyl-tRNA(Gln) amidotransferase subunit A|nr:Asp-tRNA(Asn)/Glu-tRNA(Gln) amidotransferase subunit GatA [Spirochaetaceae bacterium]
MNKELELWKGVLSDGTKKSKLEKYIKGWEEKIGSFLEIDLNRGAYDSNESGALAGIPFGVKDNIAVKGFKLTCGSKMLQTLVSPYSATVVSRLQQAGAQVIGKTNLDEFGMGSSTDNSALQQTNNPWDTERVAGGSSGGSAACVAAGLVPFALGTDTGGSVRQPASFCGIYGLKPTYGAASRYGLTAYASSLETPGILARTVATTKDVFDIIKGEDERDQSSLSYEAEGGQVKTIGYLKIEEGALNADVEASYKSSIKRLEDLEYTLVEVELPTMDYVVPAYYTIAMAEASANLARFNGIRYGYAPFMAENPNELMKKSRHEGFGDEVKLRILLGTYVLRSGFQDQFYVRSQKIRTAIRNDFEKLFTKVDSLVMPIFPTAAFHHGSSDLDSFQQKVADKYTCVANLAGLPALTIPSSVENGLPVGVQLMAPYFGEDRLFEIAVKAEEKYPAPQPEDFDLEWLS